MFGQWAGDGLVLPRTWALSATAQSSLNMTQSLGALFSNMDYM